MGSRECLPFEQYLLVFNIIIKKASVLKKILSLFLLITAVNLQANSDIAMCEYMASYKITKKVYQQAYICPNTDNEWAHHFAFIDSEAKILAGDYKQYSFKDYQHWIDNYYIFLCKIKKFSKSPETDMKKLNMFLTFRLKKGSEKNIGKKGMKEKDIKNIISFWLNTPDRHGTQLTGLYILGEYYLDPIFIDKEVDTELKDFVGLINDGKYNEAYSLMLHSKRSNEGYNYMKSFCNRITKKELFK